MKSWYRKLVPTVKDIKPFIKDIGKSIHNIKGVKSVFLWGSLAQNLENPDFVIRDVDIIAKNNFLSEDLISIIDDKNSPLKISSQKELEEDGFDYDTVNFTKQFLDIKDHNIDHWVITKNNKLLHWGAIIENKSEWDEIKEDAENYTYLTTAVKRNSLVKKSQQLQSRWFMLYNGYMNQYLNNAPKGWYYSNIKINEIHSKLIKLA
jgi:hypothetical protein